ncbi:adenylate/guanylate cyclase domain-containing protein [Mycobacterium sp.]|uniref:adenylate/guanylate cyclase domain-containing protein n=1 Tax=Mycobacterium sp. TaxID=1785 RepID=UPI003C74EF94
MGEVRAKSLMSPDETLEFPGIKVQQVDVGDLTIGRIVTQPGWRWSSDVRPHVGGEWCEARHVGIVLSGRFEVVMRDGTTLQFGPDDVFEIPPGHDGYTVGDEPCVQIEWSGLRAFAGFRHFGIRNRALVTLLFTDLVESTMMAKRLGDVAWRDVLSAHYEATRVALERHHGHEVNTTGDGLLATFDGPAAALRCAAAVARAAAREGLQIRASVHVGEVEVVGSDVRGVAVHEAARILSAAAADEILVSTTTRALAGNVGFVFQPRGTHSLKGLPGEWELFACFEDEKPKFPEARRTKA